jgi:hypothetical protein
MSRGTAVALAVLVACLAAGAVTACGASEPEAVRTITVTTEDGQRVVTEDTSDDGSSDDDTGGEDEDDEVPGCLGSGPMEPCRRVPGTEAECIAVRTDADAAIASIEDEGELAAAHLARAVALMCLGKRLDVAQDDVEFARERRGELNEFSQETLERIDVEDLPTGPGDVNEELFAPA